MGTAFSKRKKAGVNDAKLPARNVDSAPAQLEGRIPSPPPGKLHRLSDSASPESSSFPSPTISQINVVPSPPSHPPPKAKPPPPMPQPIEASAPATHQDQMLRTAQPDQLVFEPEDVNPVPEHAQKYLQVFSEPLVRGLSALMWGDRDESLKAIRNNLSDPLFLSKTDKILLWTITVEILCGSLKDKVVPVYFSSLETLRTLFSSMLPEIGDDALHESVHRLVPLLMHRVGNINARIHTGASKTLMFLASERRIGPHVVGPYALAAFKKSRSQSNMYIGRLDLVQQMLKQFSSTQGLSVSAVMTFSAAALDSPDDKLRRAATKVVCEVYRLQKMAGSSIEEKYLVSLKPAVVKKLKAKFAEIDGGDAVEGPSSKTSSVRRHLSPLEDVSMSSNIPSEGPNTGCGSRSSLPKTKSKPPRPDPIKTKKLRRNDLPGAFSPGPSEFNMDLMATCRKPIYPANNLFDAADEGLMNDILNC